MASRLLLSVALATFGLSLAGAARADVIAVTYGAAGAQTASSTIVNNATRLGTETFDARSSGNFVTDFGTNNAIKATYTGAVINAADQYGGAGGTGSYVEALAGGSGYTINFTTGGVPGVNYFGYWLSALDPGNSLTFKRAGQVVGTFSPQDVINAIGGCSASNPYCGNPTANFAGQDSNESFAFVNFVDTSGFFDEIDVMETAGINGNYESDNHTVGYCSNASACVSGTAVPEPSSVAIVATAIVGLGLLWLRRRTRA